MRIGDFRPRSVVVLRALQLGDMLCAVPALRALRAAAPGAEVTLVSLPWARAFARRFSRYVDRFVEFPGWPGLPERAVDLPAVPGFLSELQDRGFDLALQLHGSGTVVNELVALFGARRSAGFFSPGAHVPDEDSFLPWPTLGTETRRLQKLLEFLGAPRVSSALEFPLDEADQREWLRLESAHGLRPGAFVCVHPGARWRSRRWPAERFAAVVRALSREGLRVLLTGSAAERGLTRAVALAAGVPCADLAGQTSLGGLAALLSRARLLVCNDTGVSHVAAALGVRSVVVASGSDARRWAPEDRARHVTLWADAECRPCAYETCPIGHPCALDVPAELVERRAKEALAA